MLVISGFAFDNERFQSLTSFNLVIEMLFISGKTQPMSMSRVASFNLVIEMLFISGRRGHGTEFVNALCSFNLVIEMLFISGTQVSQWSFRRMGRFNLVIEMLFISGYSSCTYGNLR